MESISAKNTGIIIILFATFLASLVLGVGILSIPNNNRDFSVSDNTGPNLRYEWQKISPSGAELQPGASLVLYLNLYSEGIEAVAGEVELSYPSEIVTNTEVVLGSDFIVAGERESSGEINFDYVTSDLTPVSGRTTVARVELELSSDEETISDNGGAMYVRINPDSTAGVQNNGSGFTNSLTFNGKPEYRIPIRISSGEIFSSSNSAEYTVGSDSQSSASSTQQLTQNTISSIASNPTRTNQVTSSVATSSQNLNASNISSAVASDGNQQIKFSSTSFSSPSISENENLANNLDNGVANSTTDFPLITNVQDQETLGIDNRLLVIIFFAVAGVTGIATIYLLFIPSREE